MEVGCDNAKDGKLMEKGSTLVQAVTTCIPFPIPTIIEPLFKCVCDNKEPSDKSYPPPVKNIATKFDDGG